MENKRSSARVIFAHITIGIQLAITILFFVYVGHRLDLHFNRTPVFLVIGTILGMGIGFYHLLKELNMENVREKDDNTRKRVKWNFINKDKRG